MLAAVIAADWSPRPGYSLTPEEERTRMARSATNAWRNPRVEMNRIPDPECGPEDVILRVAAAGLCGSDLHFFETDAEGYMKYPGMARFPSVPGHEVSGVVMEAGSATRYLRPGDLVCLDDMVVCGRCDACRRGFPNQCESLDDVGFTMNGGCAELLRVPERNCWNVNALAERLGGREQALEAAAIIEPYTVAYNALFECAPRLKPGGYAVIFGAGPIGLAALGLLKSTGAARVLVFEHHPSRRAIAERMGADQVLALQDESPESVAELVRRHTGGAGADILVEAAGAFTHTLPIMELSMANGAQIIIIGRDGHRASLLLENFQVKKANLIGAMGNTGHGTYPNVIRMMTAGLLDPRPMITHRFELADFPAALAQARGRQGGKVLLKP